VLGCMPPSVFAWASSRGCGEFAAALAAYQEAAAVAQEIHAENLLSQVEAGLADRAARAR